MNNSMDNVKEISSIRRTNRNISDARERFRHLNASHRSVGRTNYRSENRYKNDGYTEIDDVYVESDVVTAKADKNFKRLMVSTGLVAFVLVIKLMDNGFSTKIETSMTNLIRNSSDLDNKISSQMVSLTEKMGININGMDKVENREVIENTSPETTSTDTSGNVEDVTDELESISISNDLEDEGDELGKTEAKTEKTDSEVISEEQVADFYIDDSVFEEIKGDSKK